MKKLTLFAISIVICFGLFSKETKTKSPKWSLQVTAPNFEVNSFRLDEKSFKPFLASTSWRCWIGETNNERSIYIKKIRCNYSSQKTGEISTQISCSKGNPYDEISLNLNDEKKGLEFKLYLFCQL